MKKKKVKDLEMGIDVTADPFSGMLGVDQRTLPTPPLGLPDITGV